MVIQRMRDGTEGIMAKIIIGLICIVFALFGFGSITTFLSPVAKVATVNGEDITQQEMEIQVERRRRMLMSQQVSIDEDELRENVLDALVTRSVLEQEAENLDLHYSEAALDADIVSNQVFQLDGQFDSQQFQNVIRGAGYSPLSFRAEMRTDKLFDQMINGIQGSAFVTDDEAKRFSDLLSQRRDVAYVQIPVTDLIDEVEVTEEEISEYYNNNLSEFVTDETVDIQYIELSRDELAATYELDEVELQEYFDANKAGYATDETRRMAHILVEISDDADAALEKATGIYDRIVNGEDFTALAKELSDDFGSRDNGGDLGFNIQGTFAPEFEAVAYDMALNQVSEPVQTEFGYHIIKLLGIEEAYEPTLDDVRMEVEQAYRYSITEDEFVNKSSDMAEMLFEDFAQLESTAQALGLEIKTTGHLTRDAAHVLMSNAAAAEAAFSPDVLLDGNNSDVIEISDDYHIGLRILEHEPSATRSLDDVNLDVTYILQREKAAELAESKANEMVSSIEGGSLAQFVADEHGVEWQLAQAATRFQAEVDPFVLTEAFKLPRPAENKESLGKAILPNGDAIVLRVSAVLNPPEDELQEDQLAGVRFSLARQLGRNDFDEYQNSLKDEAVLERD